MAEKADNDDRPSRRRIWRGAAYVALVAAGVLAAWQIHLFWVRRRQPEPVPLEIYEPDPVATSRPAGRPRLSEMAGDPVGQAGLKFLREDPGGPQPPKGATFQYAIQRVQDGCVQQHLKYRYAGDRAAAASHYARSLKARGMELLQDAPPEDPREGRTLVFRSDREQITVQLGKRQPKTSTVSIGVTVLRLVQ